MIVMHWEPYHFPSDYASMYSKIFPNLYLFFWVLFQCYWDFSLFLVTLFQVLGILCCAHPWSFQISTNALSRNNGFREKGKSAPKLFTSLTLARIWDVLLSMNLFYTNYIVQFCLYHATSRLLLWILLLHQKLLGKYLQWQWRHYSTY